MDLENWASIFFSYTSVSITFSHYTMLMRLFQFDPGNFSVISSSFSRHLLFQTIWPLLTEF